MPKAETSRSRSRSVSIKQEPVEPRLIVPYRRSTTASTAAGSSHSTPIFVDEKSRAASRAPSKTPLREQSAAPSEASNASSASRSRSRSVFTRTRAWQKNLSLGRSPSNAPSYLNPAIPSRRQPNPRDIPPAIAAQSAPRESLPDGLSSALDRAVGAVNKVAADDAGTGDKVKLVVAAGRVIFASNAPASHDILAAAFALLRASLKAGIEGYTPSRRDRADTAKVSWWFGQEGKGELRALLENEPAVIDGTSKDDALHALGAALENAVLGAGRAKLTARLAAVGPEPSARAVGEVVRSFINLAENLVEVLWP